jgi:hypothetical protein
MKKYKFYFAVGIIISCFIFILIRQWTALSTQPQRFGRLSPEELTIDELKSEKGDVSASLRVWQHYRVQRTDPVKERMYQLRHTKQLEAILNTQTTHRMVNPAVEAKGGDGARDDGGAGLR